MGQCWRFSDMTVRGHAVAQYEDMYRLCYMRGPAGIVVALAEELS